MEIFELAIVSKLFKLVDSMGHFIMFIFHFVLGKN